MKLHVRYVMRGAGGAEGGGVCVLRAHTHPP
jgi:hypothetical protein